MVQEGFFTSFDLRLQCSKLSFCSCFLEYQAIKVSKQGRHAVNSCKVFYCPQFTFIISWLGLIPEVTFSIKVVKSLRVSKYVSSDRRDYVKNQGQRLSESTHTQDLGRLLNGKPFLYENHSSLHFLLCYIREGFKK